MTREIVTISLNILFIVLLYQFFLITVLKTKKKKPRIKVLKTTLSASLCIFDLSGL